MCKIWKSCSRTQTLTHARRIKLHPGTHPTNSSRRLGGEYRTHTRPTCVPARSCMQSVWVQPLKSTGLITTHVYAFISRRRLRTTTYLHVRSRPYECHFRDCVFSERCRWRIANHLSPLLWHFWWFWRRLRMFIFDVLHLTSSQTQQVAVDDWSRWRSVVFTVNVESCTPIRCGNIPITLFGTSAMHDNYAGDDRWS